MDERPIHRLHRLLTRLARREGYAFASEAKLGQMLGRSERTVQRQFRQLKAAGAIRVERPSRTSTNRVFVLAEPDRVGSNGGSRAPKMSGRHKETVVLTRETAAAAPMPPVRRDDVLLQEKRDPEIVEQPLPIVAEHLAKALIESLKKHGVGPRVAAKLVAAHPQHVIERRLLELPYRHAEDPAAMLVSSIRDDYREPAALRVERERGDRQRVKDDLERERLERAAADRAARDHADALAAQRLAQLDAAARRRLTAAARAAVDAELARSPVRSIMPAFLIEKLVEARARGALSVPSCHLAIEIAT